MKKEYINPEIEISITALQEDILTGSEGPQVGAGSVIGGGDWEDWI